MKKYHDNPTAAHYGAERTYSRIARRYYFTGMRRYNRLYQKLPGLPKIQGVEPETGRSGTNSRIRPAF